MHIASMHVENFLSFGEADFGFESAGLVLVEGDNRDDDSARSNGAGKSAMIDALVWCLFGETLRGYKYDEVVNRKAEDGCLVRVHLTDGDELYTVTRARRHPRLKNALTVTHDNFGEDMTASGDKETQLVVEELLGCTLNTFLSSVVFGQDRAYRFSSLTDAEQKKILDEVIGVERFALACAAARKQASSTQVELDGNRRALEKTEKARDQAEADAVDLQVKDTDFAATQRKKIEAERARLAETNAQLDKARRGHDPGKLKRAHDAALKELAAAERAADKVAEQDGAARAHVARVAERRDELAARLKRQRKADKVCPTCGQKVAGESHERTLSEMRAELKKLDAERQDVEGAADDAATALAAERKKVEVARAAVVATQGAVNDAARAEADVISLRRRAADIEARIRELTDEVSPYAELAAKARSRHTQLTADADQIGAEVDQLERRLRHVEFWVKAYGASGLRSLLVDTSLPLLNREAARVSREVTGGSIVIEFSATTSQKSGKVVDKFEVRVDNKHGAGDYAGNSAGERAKIDLCVGLALQRLVASRSTASFNVAFFDEVFDHLDSAAHERVIEVLSALDKDSVFVVSHDDDLKAWFPSTLRVVKRGGFSTVEA